MLYIKKFFIEEDENSTLSKCAVLFHGINNYKLVIITSQLWKEENENSFYYLQYLFPKINFKYYDYDGIKYYRTKPFYPFTQDKIIEYNKIRKEFITKGNLKKSTDILIFTDSVNFGPAGTFIKTIQDNGAAIISSYGGNPYLNKITIKTLDIGIDPLLNTNYEKISKEYQELHKLGIEVYKIPYAEAFESANITREYKYSMAFKINKVDEMTNI